MKKMTPIDRFLWWIRERHSIYLKKEAEEPKPWTKDKVLQRYFFTNPYRENDKVTVWIRKHIRLPYAKHPCLPFMLCVARQFNWPDTLQELIDRNAWPTKRWRPTLVAKVLDQRKKRGLKVYTGAYMVRAESNRNAAWYHWSKNLYMATIVLGRVWDKRAEFAKWLQTNSMEVSTRWLQAQYGWGGFMAYEVVCDLRHTKYLRKAHDVMTWANLGPGARRGLNRIHGREVKQGLSQKQGCKEMRALLSEAQSRLGDLPLMEMREIEHSLCEFDKYERARLGVGKMKRMYAGK